MTNIIKATSLEEAAERINQLILNNQYFVRSLHEYKDIYGNTLFYRVHYKSKDQSGKKEVRPFSKLEEGSYKLGEPLIFKSSSKTLYNLDLLAKYTNAIVFVVEGEFCADQLNAFFRKAKVLGQYLAITSGSSSSAQGADWSQLNGHKVIIWPDHDSPGQNYAQDVLSMLNELASELDIIDVQALGLQEHGDVVDWLAANPEATIKELVVLPKALIEDDSLQGIPCSIEQWPEPEPLEFKLRPVPPLPLELIPEPLRKRVADISHRMQNPPEHAAASLITIIGSIIGTGCGIRPKCYDDWLVIPNLYGAIIGKPGVIKKSPTMSEVSKPLKKLEAKARAAYNEALFNYDIKKEQLEATKAKLKKAAKHQQSDPDSVAELYKELLQQEKPSCRRYSTNDTTTEKMTELLNENPRGLLVIQDELTSLFASWERTGREQDRTYYLEAWNGKGDRHTDRINRGSIHTSNMCLSIFGGIQPKKLQQYLNLQISELSSDGMIQRFQMMLYPDEHKDWKNIDKKPDKEAKNRVDKIVNYLSNVNFVDLGATLEPDERIPYFHFDDEAQELFNQWLTEHEIEKVRGPDDDTIIEHLSKYIKLMPALALIFHLIDIADEGIIRTSISLKHAEMAAAWCDFLEEHARRIYDLGHSIDKEAASKLARKIARGEINDKFTVRSIYRNKWSGLTSQEIVLAACDILVEKKWLIEKETAKGFQQRSTIEYHINPKSRGFYG